jgi:hypothetical protein
LEIGKLPSFLADSLLHGSYLVLDVLRKLVMEILCGLHGIHLGPGYALGGFPIEITFGMGFGATIMTLPARFMLVTLLSSLHGQQIATVRVIRGRDRIVSGGMSQ